MKRTDAYYLELTEKAEYVYRNSSFVIYEENETYYIADNGKDKPHEIGSINDVNEYLEMFFEEE